MLIFCEHIFSHIFCNFPPFFHLHISENRFKFMPLFSGLKVWPHLFRWWDFISRKGYLLYFFTEKDICCIYFKYYFKSTSIVFILHKWIFVVFIYQIPELEFGREILCTNTRNWQSPQSPAYTSTHQSISPPSTNIKLPINKYQPN